MGCDTNEIAQIMKVPILVCSVCACLPKVHNKVMKESWDKRKEGLRKVTRLYY